jgi:arsenate reductase
MTMKNVLILCTGNSCRSIMAEALLNAELGASGLAAYSSGTNPKAHANPQALETIKRNGLSLAGLRAKPLGEVLVRDYDLVVTVCDNAKEACPVFPGQTRVIHESFQDPDDLGEGAFQACFEAIRARLLPRVALELGLPKP